MKKIIKTVAIGLTASMLLSTTAFASMWYDPATDTWTSHSNLEEVTEPGWHWIDWFDNGVANCYYYDTNGKLVTNGVTPDGYEVNATGAWVVDGVVQERKNQPLIDQRNEERAASYRQMIEHIENFDYTSFSNTYNLVSISGEVPDIAGDWTQIKIVVTGTKGNYSVTVNGIPARVQVTVECIMGCEITGTGYGITIEEGGRATLYEESQLEQLPTKEFKSFGYLVQ